MRLTAAETPLSLEEAVRISTAPGLPVQRVVLAVSGGPDSVAMMGLFAEARKMAPLPEASVATVNHDLRPEAAQEAESVASLARSLGFEHAVLHWKGRKPKTGIQEAARNARYKLLSAHAKSLGAEAILVAHTLDDQAETVLMRLMRGSGLKGLGGMDMLGLSHGLRLHRPLLSIPKVRLVATCAARGWPFVTDPANSNADFLRARLRTLAPSLAGEGLTAERLSRLAARMRRADEALDSAALTAMEACRIWKRGETLYDAEKLTAEPAEIVVRIFLHVVAMGRDAAGSGPPVRLERIEALAESFRDSVMRGAPFRRNASGMLFTLRKGVLSLRAEPARSAANLRHKSQPARQKD